MTEPHDPIHPLDGVEPTGTWDDVVARAAGPADTPLAAIGDHRRGRRILAAAATVVVLAAVAGGIAIANRGDDDGQQAVHAAEATGDAPTKIWGRRWAVTAIERRSKPVTVVPAADVSHGGQANVPLVLDASQDGILRFNGCNGAGGQAHLDGDRIQADGAWNSTVMGCMGEDGPRLIDQDEWLGSFLRHEPVVRVSGDALVLTNEDGDRVELVDAATFAATPDLWGRTFAVERIFYSSGEVPAARGSGPSPIEISFVLASPERPAGKEDGHLDVSLCDGSTAPVSTRRTYLVTGTVSAPGCADDPTNELWSLLSSEPMLQQRGDRIWISQGASSLQAVEVRSGEVGATTTSEASITATTGRADPATTTSVGSSDATTTTVADPTTTTSTLPTDTIPFGPGGSAADADFFGFEWIVVKVVENGTERSFPGAVVDTRTYGRVSVTGCNGAGGAMHLVDHSPTQGQTRLVSDGGWAHTDMACVPTDGKPDLMARDDFFDQFLAAGPTLSAFGLISGQGYTLSLFVGDSQVDLRHG